MGNTSSMVQHVHIVQDLEDKMADKTTNGAEINESAEQTVPELAKDGILPILQQNGGTPCQICAKYVKYVPELYCDVEGQTKVWWFPSDFCQSRLGDRQIGSNACTLIAVILAHRIEGQEIAIYGHADQPLSRHLISALAESIVDGNEIHELLATNGKLLELDLTLPEAMRACGQYSSAFNSRTQNKHLTEWKSVFQMTEIQMKLFEDLHRGIIEWEMKIRTAAPESNLFVVLITGGRSVLCVYQRSLQQITLIDTHCHGDYGAVVAQVAINELEQLCTWYDATCHRVFQSRPQSYEISFLYFKCDPVFPLIDTTNNKLLK